MALCACSSSDDEPNNTEESNLSSETVSLIGSCLWQRAYSYHLNVETGAKSDIYTYDEPADPATVTEHTGAVYYRQIEVDDEQESNVGFPIDSPSQFEDYRVNDLYVISFIHFTIDNKGIIHIYQPPYSNYAGIEDYKVVDITTDAQTGAQLMELEGVAGLVSPNVAQGTVNRYVWRAVDKPIAPRPE